MLRLSCACIATRPARLWASGGVLGAQRIVYGMRMFIIEVTSIRQMTGADFCRSVRD